MQPTRDPIPPTPTAAIDPRPAAIHRRWLVCCLLWLCCSCTATGLHYYPAQPPSPLHDALQRPLLAQIVVDQAPTYAAPRADAAAIGRLDYGSRHAVYAFVPARTQAARQRYLLIGPPDAPGSVQGWVRSQDLLCSDAQPAGWALVHGAGASPPTDFRAGPGVTFKPLGSTERQFLLARYTTREGHQLLGATQSTESSASRDQPPQLRILGWLPATSCQPWQNDLGAYFDKDTFGQRPRAVVVSRREDLTQLLRGAPPDDDTILYAESEHAAPPAQYVVRFPVLQRLADEPGTLHLALPGGDAGWTSERTHAGVNQTCLDRLTERRWLEQLHRLLGRVADQAGDDPRNLPAAVHQVWEDAPGAARDGTGDELRHLLHGCDEPTHARLPSSARNGDGFDACRQSLSRLQRSLAYLDSALGEYAVIEQEGMIRPYLPHPWSREPQRRHYWWHTPWGVQYAWVPERFFPRQGAATTQEIVVRSRCTPGHVGALAPRRRTHAAARQAAPSPTTHFGNMASKTTVQLTAYCIDFLGSRVLGNRWSSLQQGLLSHLAGKADAVVENDLWGPTHRFPDPASAVQACQQAIDGAKSSARWKPADGPVPVQFLLHHNDPEQPLGLDPKSWIYLLPAEIYVTKTAWEAWRQAGMVDGLPPHSVLDENLTCYRLTLRERAAAPLPDLFPKRRLALNGTGSECYYCGRTDHIAQRCPSRNLRPGVRGLHFAGKLSLQQLDQAYTDLFDGKQELTAILAAETRQSDLRNNPKLQIYTAFLDLRRIYQLRFLGQLFLSNAESWSDVLRTRGNLGDSPTTFYQGFQALQAKNYPEAEKLFSDVKGQDDSSKFISQVGLAFVALERGQPQKMEFHLSKASKLATMEAEHTYVHFLLSRLREVGGDIRGALEEMDRALTERRYNDDLRYRREQLSVAAGKYDGCAQRLQVVAARNPELAVALTIDPWFEPIRPELDRALLTLLLSAHQVGCGKFATVRKRGSALASWLGEQDPDVVPVVSGLQRLNGNVNSASYFDMLELDKTADQLITSCEATRKSRLQALRKQLEAIRKHWEPLEEFWKEFPLKKMYARLGAQMLEGQEKLDKATQLATSENVADYREVMDLLGGVREHAADLSHEFRQVGAMPLVLSFIRRLLAYLILFESLALAIGLFIIPLFRTILTLDRGGRPLSANFSGSATYTLVLAVAPVMAVVVTAIKQRRAHTTMQG